MTQVFLGVVTSTAAALPWSAHPESPEPKPSVLPSADIEEEENGMG
jgi:hypothetical protein